MMVRIRLEASSDGEKRREEEEEEKKRREDEKMRLELRSTRPDAE